MLPIVDRVEPRRTDFGLIAYVLFSPEPVLFRGAFRTAAFMPIAMGTNSDFFVFQGSQQRINVTTGLRYQALQP